MDLSHSIDRIARWMFPAFVALAFFDQATNAQEAHILDLRGPGSSSVFVSQSDRTAYITDGGKGKHRGLMGASMDGKPILNSLLDRGIERLVITCSHPHSDHADGLLDMVRTDEIMNKQFKEIHFVDSDVPSNKRLHDSFVEKWGPNHGERVKEHVAMNKNVLGQFSSATSSVKAQNFAYDPSAYNPKATSHVHGRCVITLYELERNGKKHRIVDFDDAETRLVNEWAKWAGELPEARRPNTVLLPHHGSSHNDIQALLIDERIRPTNAVITVNEKNQYKHPGPDVLQKVMRALGKENVYFSSSDGNLVLTESGIRSEHSPGRFQRDYEKFVEPHHLANESQLLDLEAKKQSGRLTPKQEDQYEKHQISRKNYLAVADLMLDGSTYLTDFEEEAKDRIAEERRRERRIRETYRSPYEATRESPFPKPGEFVSPVVALAEEAAKQYSGDRSEVHSKFTVIRSAIANGDFANVDTEVARLLTEHRTVLTPVESLSLQQIRSGLELLRVTDPSVADLSGVAIENAIHWPEMAGPAGAKTLEIVAQREFNRFATDAEPFRPEGLRRLAQILEKSPKSTTQNRMLCEVSFALFLSGDTSAALRYLPEQPVSRIAEQMLADTQAVMRGKGQIQTLAAQQATKNQTLTNRFLFPPNFPSELTAAESTWSKPEIDSLGRSSPTLNQSERLASIETIQQVALDLVESRISVIETEAKSVERLVSLTKSRFAEPLLIHEKYALWSDYFRGESLSKCVSELSQSRETIRKSALMNYYLARSFDSRIQRSISMSDLVRLRNSDIGFTPKNISLWESVLEKNRQKAFLLASLPEKPGGGRYLSMAEYHRDLRESIERMQATHRRIMSRYRSYGRFGARGRGN